MQMSGNVVSPLCLHPQESAELKIHAPVIASQKAGTTQPIIKGDGDADYLPPCGLCQWV